MCPMEGAGATGCAEAGSPTQLHRSARPGRARRGCALASVWLRGRAARVPPRRTADDNVPNNYLALMLRSQWESTGHGDRGQSPKPKLLPLSAQAGPSPRMPSEGSDPSPAKGRRRYHVSPSMRVSDLLQPTFQKEVPNPGAAGEARAPDALDPGDGPEQRPAPSPPPSSRTLVRHRVLPSHSASANRREQKAKRGGRRRRWKPRGRNGSLAAPPRRKTLSRLGTPTSRQEEVVLSRQKT